MPRPTFQELNKTIEELRARVTEMEKTQLCPTKISEQFFGNVSTPPSLIPSENLTLREQATGVRAELIDLVVRFTQAESMGRILEAQRNMKVLLERLKDEVR